MDASQQRAIACEQRAAIAEARLADAEKRAERAETGLVEAEKRTRAAEQEAARRDVQLQKQQNALDRTAVKESDEARKNALSAAKPARARC
ncbi:MAG: hypothetical protein MZV65_30200 [Chromatiales bacterium]|nr:hypothetical protein [Chromatiales bacterium]